MIVVDTSAIVALMDRGDRNHPLFARWIAGVRDDLATTPLVVAEVDHLVADRGGSGALRAFREDLRRGAYIVEWWPGVLGRSLEIAERYEGLALGLTDASLVALADRLATNEIATVDQRHFRAVRPLSVAKAFRLVPLDSS